MALQINNKSDLMNLEESYYNSMKSEFMAYLNQIKEYNEFINDMASSIPYFMKKQKNDDPIKLMPNNTPYFEKYSDWQEALESINENKFNPDFIPEKLVREYRDKISREFITKYPFMKRYSDLFPEFENFKNENAYEIVEIANKSGKQRIQAELINITEKELYFPNIKMVYSCHSATHSIGMLLEKYNKEFKGHEIMLYELPQFVHAGDKEYVMYVAEQLGIPLVILSRKENTAYNLMKNGVPKANNFRFCTRIYKIEPSQMFYEKYFYPMEQRIKYKLSKSKLIEMLKSKGIELTPKVKRSKKRTIVKIALKNLIGSDNSKYEVFELDGQKLKPTNIIQSIGIASYQSDNRAKMNPDLVMAKISDPKNRFFVYEYFPIFDMDFPELEQLILDAGLKRNPYELEYKCLRPEYRENKKEVRMGCIVCPYKQGDYYLHLKETHPSRYYFCHFLRSVCSAKNILRQNREYYYYDENDTPKKKPEWLNII